jgi:hypothetical protein
MYRTQGEHANHYTTDAEGSLHITLCILKKSTMTLSGSLVGILVNDELFVIFCVASVTIPGSSMLVEF